MNASPDAPDTIPVRNAHKFDVAALERYLTRELSDFAGPLTVRQFEGGQSNPTFALESKNRLYVLRKKPPGQLLASAHQVEREYRIMKALGYTDFPVPEMLLLCENPEIIGTNFFVMDYIHGRIFRDPKLPGLSRSARSEIYKSMCETLARLHIIDYKTLGLEDIGRKDGYIARQIFRWSIAYQKTKTSEIAAMANLTEFLYQNIPEDNPEHQEIGLVHGDFRLENLIFHPTESRVIAVLDWELSTLGHPLADLGHCSIPYHLPSELAGVPGLEGLDYKFSGIPTEPEFVQHYAQLTNRAAIDDYKFFVVFALFRLASIAQGVRQRATQGNASSEKAEKVGQLAELFADTAWRLAKQIQA